MGNFVIPFKTIRLKKLIGQGTFGTVFAGNSSIVESNVDLACKTFVPIDPSITQGLMEPTMGGYKDEENEKKISLVRFHRCDERFQYF